MNNKMVKSFKQYTAKIIINHNVMVNVGAVHAKSAQTFTSTHRMMYNSCVSITYFMYTSRKLVVVKAMC